MRKACLFCAGLLFAAPAPAASPAAPASVTSGQAENGAKSWAVQGGAEYRGLVVFDQDRANDHAMLYFAQGQWKPLDGLTTFLRVGVMQQFSVEEGESPFFLQDTSLGASASWTAKVPQVDREVTVAGTLQAYLPTSRASQYQELYVAPELRLSASTHAFWRVDVGLDGRAQYRFHRYAERAGPGGGMNTRTVLSLRPWASVLLWDFQEYGKLSASADYSRSFVLRYGSRETYLSEASEAAPWFNTYGWGAALSYQPHPMLSASLSISQGGSVLRNGIVNTFAFHRDETELGLGLSARY